MSSTAAQLQRRSLSLSLSLPFGVRTRARQRMSQQGITCRPKDIRGQISRATRARQQMPQPGSGRLSAKDDILTEM